MVLELLILLDTTNVSKTSAIFAVIYLVVGNIVRKAKSRCPANFVPLKPGRGRSILPAPHLDHTRHLVC